MGAQLYWERDSGNLELYVMSPAPMMGILTGMALGGMVTTFIRAIAITTAGVLMFDVPLHPTSWWLLAGVFLLTLTALYGMGMMLASVIPLTLGMDAMRQVLFNAPEVFPVETEMGVLAVLSVAFLFGAHRCLRYLERRAREDGKLTVRWQ